MLVLTVFQKERSGGEKSHSTSPTLRCPCSDNKGTERGATFVKTLLCVRHSTICFPGFVLLRFHENTLGSRDCYSFFSMKIFLIPSPKVIKFSERRAGLKPKSLWLGRLFLYYAIIHPREHIWLWLACQDGTWLCLFL